MTSNLPPQDVSSSGRIYQAGVDEVGRGPLAGPVTAACVVLPEGYSNADIADSKKVAEKKRERLYDEIYRVSLACAVVCVGPRRIEQLNIREASRLAMQLAAERAYRILRNRQADHAAPTGMHLQIDGNVPIDLPKQASPETTFTQETIIKGDEKVLCISAASIVAKVTRDRLMATIDGHYPGYEFKKHKGYPTKLHRSCIVEHGPCRVHRRTFGGVREFVSAPATQG